MHFGV